MNNINTPQNLKLVGFYESRSGRWYVTEDRAWKVRLNNDNEATAIRDGREVYRLVGDTAYNSRTGSPVNPELNIHRDIAAMVNQARRAERR